MAIDEPAGRPGFRPLHPGAILRHDLAALGISQENFAVHINVSRQTVSAILAGRSKLSAELAAKISRSIGGSTLFWLNLQTAHDAWAADREPQVRLIQRVNAGKAGKRAAAA
jgi:antitoxin HigA-1